MTLKVVLALLSDPGLKRGLGVENDSDVDWSGWEL